MKPIARAQPDPEETVIATDAQALYERQRKWLFGMIMLNLGSIPLDYDCLSASHFHLALAMRLGIITPIAICGLLCNRWCSNRLIKTVTSAATIVVFIAATAILGQVAPEPVASRYMMAALFVLYTSSIFTALPFRHTRLQTIVAALAYSLITASGLTFPPAFTNLSMIGVCLMVVLIGLHIRREKEVQYVELLAMRRIEAERSAELRELNAKLSHLLTTDSLTGVFNRRYLDSFLVTSASSRVGGSEVGALMVDVDHFKKFNDHGGHAEGDRCLREVAAALRAAVRSSDDVVARYGGEEFAVILPFADRAVTLMVAERLRQAIVDLNLQNPGLPPGEVVTVSIGGAVAPSMAGVEEALRRADKALYIAKQTGRNRAHIEAHTHGHAPKIGVA